MGAKDISHKLGMSESEVRLLVDVIRSVVRRWKNAVEKQQVSKRSSNKR